MKTGYGRIKKHHFPVNALLLTMDAFITLPGGAMNTSTTHPLIDWINSALRAFNTLGEGLGPLLLRLLLAVEFWAAGREKWLGDNWFADIQSSFPWPFSVIDPTVSWHMATWAELGGAVLLVLGLGTRFAAASLMVLTVVATWAVHWPAELNQWADLPLGYVITDEGHGNFKLPLIYLVMFVPLLLNGGGAWSLDRLCARRWA